MSLTITVPVPVPSLFHSSPVAAGAGLEEQSAAHIRELIDESTAAAGGQICYHESA